MADAKYFIRSRGRVTGPFDLPALTRLVRRGMLLAVDEISENRTSWSRAGDYDELFPGHESAIASSGSTSTKSAVVEISPAVVPPPPLAAQEERYFYQQRGVTVGPVPTAVLLSLAQNGT